MSEVKLNRGAIDLGIVTHNIDKMIAFYSDSLGFKKNEIMMIGDDIISDIGGAKSNDIKAIQVKTGKYQPKDEVENIIQPDYRINSIADLLFI